MSDDVRAIVRLVRVVGVRSVDLIDMWKGARASRAFVERQRAQIARVLQ